MKQILKIALTLLLLSGSGFSQAAERQKIDFCEDWKFTAAASADPATWQPVSLPHTWNNLDAQNGGDDYLRTEGWYHKTLAWQNDFEGKRLFLECLGANMQAECFVNGSSVGVHKGGYTAFRFDITDKLTKGENRIAVKVDNRYSEEIAPLTADFSFFGGLYRKVYLIVAEEVHFDLADSGASGLYLTPKHVSERDAELEIRAKIVNTSDRDQTLSLLGTLSETDAFAEITGIHALDFDPKDMKTGRERTAFLQVNIVVPAKGSYDFSKTISVNSPKLWNGRKAPFRYQVRLTLKDRNEALDEVSDHVAFRYFKATKEGFSLNGKPYPLRGVNRHQDRKDMGNAITEKEHDEDFALIYNMGANAIRLAHYPQSPYFYELCDRYGIVVWAEIPFVDHVGKAETFAEVTKTQLRELIRQQYNRPSILFWGLQNEVKTLYDSIMAPLMRDLNDLAHAEDPSRYTVQATNHDPGMQWPSDLIAWNSYPGWYSNGSLGDVFDEKDAKTDRPLGFSEYGYGANVRQHETVPQRPKHNGPWHPEEYQSLMHEKAIAAIAERPQIWGTFLWNMFDFAVDKRNEGEQPGINDKGLVTYDRQTLKDSYFAYKVNWNPAPEIYIAGRRNAVRPESHTPLTVYSNCDEAELFINGKSFGKKRKTETQCGIFRWENIPLAEGENAVKVIGKWKEKKLVDEVRWWRKAGEPVAFVPSDRGLYPTVSNRFI
jgi:beta-galactosidase/beta-glucuronidase